VPRRTIAEPVVIAGTGLHTGATVRARFAAGHAGQGIVLRRTDLEGQPAIPALAAWVIASDRRTALERNGARVETVEHALAACAALELDDVTIEVDGPELPILDGSFAGFFTALREAGTAEQAGEVTWLEPAAGEVSGGGGAYRIEPADRLGLAVSLDSPHPRIGRQRWQGSPLGPAFGAELAAARTWGRLDEAEGARARGLLLGASMDCAIVLSETTVVNTELRWPDEFVRHKAGDLLGDLALAGGRLRARVTAHQPSHLGNLACARAVIASAGAPEAT
jgi:UDP-3-O-[3-hydroxymyristoyl] N-acetylglucosamine deacetylase / 3-hydroxyacyl-[acyl-carrier-protein] dehydratase